MLNIYDLHDLEMLHIGSFQLSTVLLAPLCTTIIFQNLQYIWVMSYRKQYQVFFIGDG